MKRLGTLKDKIEYRIKRSKDNVFFISDFADLSDNDQILRALKKITDEKMLIRVGKGVYVKTRMSSISKNILPAIGLREIGEAVVLKNGAQVKLTPEQVAYNQKRTTQVPNNYIIGTNKRISRNIEFNGSKIKYELVN